MARKERNTLIAGIFVIVCSMALVGVVIWLGGLSMHGETIYISAPVMAGDTGLQVGSKVKYGSLQKGKITAILEGVDSRNFLIEVRMTDAVTGLRSDALVETSVATLVGGSADLVILSPGTPSAPPPTREHPIPLHIGPNPLIRDLQNQIGYREVERKEFQTILANLDTLSANLTQISAGLKDQLTVTGKPNMLSDAVDTMARLKDSIEAIRQELDPKNPQGMLAKTHSSLDDVNAMTGRLTSMVNVAAPYVEEATASAADAADRINGYTRDDLGVLLKSLRESSTQLLGIMQDFREVSSAAKQVVAFNKENIDEMLNNLTQVSVNLKAASREVRMNPWKLMGKPTISDIRSQNIQEAARAFAEGAAELDDAVRKLTVVSQMNGQPIPADDPQLQQIRQKIKESFGKFSRAEQALWDEMAK